MHYETIAQIAKRLDLLQSTARNPEIIMSTILSREAADPQSSIRKVRPGVYELAMGKSTRFRVGRYEGVGVRVRDLRDEVKCDTDRAVVRRALFLLRRCSDVAGDAGSLTLGDGILDLAVDLLEPPKIREQRDNMLGPREESVYDVRLDRALIQGAEDLSRRLGLQTIDEVIELAVSVTELASRLHSDGLVVVAGRGVLYDSTDSTG